MKHYVISGPFFMYSSTRDIGARIQPPAFFVNCTVLADPRLPITTFSVNTAGSSFVLIGKDSSGNSLPDSGAQYTPESEASYGFNGSVIVPWPEHPGEAISLITMTVNATTLGKSKHDLTAKLELKDLPMPAH
jgi:hypothetical protein